MAQKDAPPGKAPDVSRRTLRLTIKTSEDGYELVSMERLQMTTPGQPGEPPTVGRHGGFWLELHDGKKKLLAHRLIDASVLNSAEVHSPDGNIEHQFGGTREGVFEVLLPDIPGAKSAVLVGVPFKRPKGRAKVPAVSRELARFDLSPDQKDAR